MSVKKNSRNFDGLPEAMRSIPMNMSRAQARQVAAWADKGRWSPWLLPVFNRAFEVLDEHVFISFETYEERALSYVSAVYGLSDFPENLLFDGWSNEWHWQDVVDESLADLQAA